VICIDVDQEEVDTAKVILSRVDLRLRHIEAGPAERLQQTGSGYTLTDANDTAEAYDANGRLVTVTSRAGVVQTLTYNGSDSLANVTDSFGHSITIGYDSLGRLSSVTGPDLAAVQYGYDTSGRLASVINADASTRSYVYENASFPNALTGVVDESSNRYSTWGYGKANAGHIALRRAASNLCSNAAETRRP
jgi:YD repeat-containing protein